MTEEFREWVDELAQGLNFPENSVVLCTSVNNEDDQMHELSCHIDGKLDAVSAIVELIVKHYLKPLDDKTAKIYGDRLINIIKNNGGQRQMTRCAWLGIDGRCQEEIICSYNHRRIKCKKKCNRHTNKSDLVRKLNEETTDRPLTRDTKYLVKLWHGEGMTSCMIASMLNRSVRVIEKILHDEI